jgi:hypothetical protein
MSSDGGEADVDLLRVVLGAKIEGWPRLGHRAEGPFLWLGVERTVTTYDVIF